MKRAVISVEKGTVQDFLDIVRRSPVADKPNAVDIIREASYRSIEVRQGLVNGEVACMWGLIPPTLLSDTAYLWLLTTNLVEEHKFLFVRHSQMYVKEALNYFPNIVGDVMVTNVGAKRWLKWLGAEFGESDGRKIPFVIRRKALHG